MEKRRMRIYFDTSAFGGYFDDEFNTPTRKFFALGSSRRYTILVSDLLAEEMENAPLRVRELVAQSIVEGAEHITTTSDALLLQEAYLSKRIVSRRYTDDALHVALATIARADAIASWNFRHLVNPLSVRAFSEVNMANGYGSVIILTPGDIVKVLEVDHE